jgi:hypothetical protein
MTSLEREVRFGKFAFEPAPIEGNPENIKITDGWNLKNIKSEPIHVAGSPRKARLHKSAIGDFRLLWAAWHSAGLLSSVLTWNGGYVARYVRGSTERLSNHSWGSAFDINAAWNRLGHLPAMVGHKGCVYDLIPLANQHGFWWGGHFESRPDGMHFEIGTRI